VLIDDFDLAKEYRKQWDLLKDAGDTTPADLKESNSEPRDPDLGHTPVRLWFTPTVGQVDLKQARKIIGGAKQAILFLMFNPAITDLKPAPPSGPSRGHPRVPVRRVVDGSAAGRARAGGRGCGGAL
jgi:hypothetical protein